MIDTIEDGEVIDSICEFKDLSDEAKQKAREKFLEGGGYPYDDWWDNTYEDAVTCGELLGIHISKRDARTMNNSTVKVPDISFSGFWSQGDGACFAGYYRLAEKIAGIKEHAPEDKVLHGLAERLGALQSSCLLVDAEMGLSASILHGTSNYCHSGTMNIEVDESSNWPDEFCKHVDKEVTACMREFADWIYKQLEDEHTYLCSDEVVDGYLDDLKFDGDGDEIDE